MPSNRRRATRPRRVSPVFCSCWVAGEYPGTVRASTAVASSVNSSVFVISAFVISLMAPGIWSIALAVRVPVVTTASRLIT